MDRYQTVWPRICAAIIDSLVLAPVGFVVSLVLAFGGESRLAGILGAALTGFVSVFYYIWMHGKYGRTFGKMAARVKVLDERETPLDFNHAIIRSLPQMIPAMHAVAFAGNEAETSPLALILAIVLGGFYVLDVLFFFCTDRHRALHDLIARTVVVKTDA